ncbi:hypothetical protein D3C72_2074010 [compost metagenome]
MNWMRRKSAASTWDRVEMERVLARPGTPSRRMCPSARRAISRRSSRWDWPTMTWRTSSRMVVNLSEIPRTFSLASRMVLSIMRPPVGAFTPRRTGATMAGAAARAGRNSTKAG